VGPGQQWHKVEIRDGERAGLCSRPCARRRLGARGGEWVGLAGVNRPDAGFGLAGGAVGLCGWCSWAGGRPGRRWAGRG